MEGIKMRKIVIISLLLIIGLNGFGQKNISQFVDSPPLFNSSDGDTSDKLIKAHFDGCGLNLSSGEKNTVIFTSFVIDSTGTPSSPILLKGTDSTMFKSVIDCMKKTRKWTPAIKNGKNVSCRYNFAFN